MTARHAATYDLEFEEPPPPLRSLTPATPAPRKGRKVVTPPDYIAPDSHRPHGTRVKYVIERCRCEPCRAANREASRARQKAMSRPDEAWVPYVPAGPARRHVRSLMEQGVGPKSIAKLSGVPHGAISKLMYGDYVRGTKPSKRIRPETARKILAVTVDQAAGAQKIDAAPTWRLLDDLIARGWTKTYLAQRLGSRGPGLQIRRTLVRASTARKVEQLHTELAGLPVPPRRSRWSK